MITKAFVENQQGSVARITFTLTHTIWADVIYLVGDFNAWEHRSHPFNRDRDGGWRCTVELPLGHVYQFRYLRDGDEWINDDQSDAYVYNLYGGSNFLIITDPTFKPHWEN